MRAVLLSRRPVALLAAAALLTTGGIASGLLVGSAAAGPLSITFATNPVNAANQRTVTVRGTDSPGDVVNITASDGTTTVPANTPSSPPVTARTGADGTYDSGPTLDVSTLRDGTITITVTSVVNGAVTRNVAKDTVPPAAPTNLTVTPTPINRANQRAITVTATAGADAASVRLAISDGVSNVTQYPTASGTTYTATFDVTTLRDGLLTVTAAAADAAGNENAATTTVTKDTVAPNAPALAFAGTASNPTRVNVANPGPGNKITVSDGGVAESEPSTYVVTVTDSIGAVRSFTPTSATPSTNYSVLIDPYPFADGNLSFSVVATDRVGNASAPTAATIGKDTSIPVVSGLTVTPNPVNSARQANVVVSGRVLQFFGSSLPSEPGTTVLVTIMGTDITIPTPVNGVRSCTRTQSVTITADGSFSSSFDTSNCQDGPQSLTASARPTDLSGNAGPTASTKADKDTTAPGKPTVTSLANALPSNLTAVPFSGTAEAGSTVVVTVKDSGTRSVSTTVTAASNGAFTGTVDATSLADGTISATAVATDSAGNASVASDPRSANKDTITFALVSTSPTNGATIGPNSSVQATYNEPLSITGSSITVKTAAPGNVPVPGNTSYSGDGRTISFTPAAPFPSGSYVATIVGMESGAGNDPAITTTVNFTVDAAVASAPVLTSITNPVNAANKGAVHVKGTADAGANVVVTIKDSSTDPLTGQPAPKSASSAPTTVAPDGSFDAVVDTTALRDGPLSATAVATKATNGTTSATSNTVTATKDTVAPTVTGTSATDTSQATPRTTVTASSGEAGDAVSVTLTDRNGLKVTASTTSGAGGAISVQVDATSLADGSITVSVVATDPAGNPSAPGTASFSKDTVGPTVTGLAGTTVNIAAGGKTTVSGSIGEPGTVTITVSDGTTSVSSTPPVTSNGSFSVSVDVSSLADGSLTLTAVAKDARGNTGPAATAAVTKDTVKPVVTGLAATGTTGVNNMTAVTGTTEPGATVTVTITDGVKSATKTVMSASNGKFGATFDLSGYKSGSLPVTAQATDAAGNVGDPATTTATRDATGPTITSLAATATTTATPASTVTGNVDDPKATIALTAKDKNNATTTGTAAVDGTGRFSGSLNLSTLADGPITVSAQGTDAAGNVGAVVTTTTSKDTTPAIRYAGVTPARVLDTRDGTGAPVGAVGPYGVVSLQVTGRGGVPPSGVSAVVLNVTVTAPTAPGYLTAYPDGTTRPTASNLNFVAGQTVPNLVVVPVSADGKVALFNGSPGQPHFIADVAGYYTAGNLSAPGTFGALAPSRLLDTRAGTGAPQGAVGPDGLVALQVTGRGGVPSSGVSAVVLNVTVTEPTAAGYLTAYPNGTSRPTASNLNFVAGKTVPNLVVVPVSADGQVALFNGSPGTVEFVADVAGFYTAGTPASPGAFAALSPLRLLDTRDGTGAAPGAVAAEGTVHLQVNGRGGVPASGVSAVVLNVTVTAPTANGFLTAYPTGATRPTASNLNFVPGQTVANLVIVPVSADGKVALFNGSPGSAHLVADVAGYYLS